MVMATIIRLGCNKRLRCLAIPNLNTRQAPDKVDPPVFSAKFTVHDDFEAKGFLLLDHFTDRFVFDLMKFIKGHLARLAGRAGLD